MKNKIFFSHILNDYSGSPRVLRDAIEAIKESDIEINIITNKNIGFLSNIDNVNYIYVNYSFHKNKFIQIIFFLLVQIELFFKLSYFLVRARCKGFNCKVINNTMLPFGSGIAGFLFAKENLYYIHEVYIKPEILKSFLLFIIDNTATKVIYVSNFLKKETKLLNVDEVVIYNVLRSDFNSIDNIDFYGKYQRKEIFFASSLKDYKGIYNLIKIAGKVPDVTFSLALNCEEKEFISFSEVCSEYRNINLYLRPSNIEELYLRSFVVLNLTIPELCIETFGLSILEGISYGCVPIVPPVGGPVELVKDNFGFKISSNNIDQVSSIINTLCNDYELWLDKAMSAKSFSEKFDREEYRSNIISILGII
ncbi:glycosyltransferase [Photobacterium damselae]|uniref:Glycosyltransferase family 4 protein n=1 Tax=Photobacterium damselae subsp. damselae TaxID=85581 RepID=A0AAD3ZWB3_PHODD|nr:glycosyltransferase [Photobacterium damselae]KAB1183220.1 glycosyltransferase family 4 protein [Photobacterium damselae subsp. damselae]